MKKKLFMRSLIGVFLAVAILFVSIIKRLVYGTPDMLTIILCTVGAFALIIGVSIVGWWMDKDEDL